MARIPIYQKQFVTLTQATIIPASGINGQQYDVTGKAIPPQIKTTPLYIDAVQINGLSEYFDPNTQVYLNLRLLNVGIGFTPVIVTETYTAIKTILDSIDCTKLCTDS